MGTIAEMAFAPSSANVGLLNLDTSPANSAAARDLQSMQIQEKAIANQAAQEKQAKQQYLMQYFKQNGISEDSIKNYGATTGDVETTQTLLQNYQEQLKRNQDQEKTKLEIERLKNEDMDFRKESIARLARGIDFASAQVPLDANGQELPQTDEQRHKMLQTRVRLAHLIGTLHQNGMYTPIDAEGNLVPPDKIDFTQLNPGQWQGWLETLKQTGTPVKEQINEVNKDEDQAFREKQLSSTAGHQAAVLENTKENQKTQQKIAESNLAINQEKLSLERQREAQKLAEKKKQEEIEKGNKIADYDDTIQVIDQLATHRGTPGLVGLKSASSFWGLTKEPVNGTPEAGAKALYDAFVAKMTMGNMGKIKGTLSDSDMKTLRAASTTLSTTTDEQQFKSELKRVRNFLERSKYNIAHDIYYEGDKIVKNKDYDEQTDTKPSTGTKKSIKPGEVFKHSNGVTIQRVE